MKTDLEGFAASLKHGMFGSRDTVAEAFEYAYEVLKALDPKLHIYAFTALHVVVNSISDELLRISDEHKSDTHQAGANKQDARPFIRTPDSGVQDGREAT